MFNLEFYELFIVIFLIFINFAVFFMYMKKTKVKKTWFLPFTIFNITYLFNYPLKAFILVSDIVDKNLIEVVIPYSFEEFLNAFMYSTAYYVVFNFFILYVWYKYIPMVNTKEFLKHYDKYKYKLIHFSLFLFFIITFVFIIKFSSFKYYGFGHNEQYGLFDLLITNFEPMKYLAVFLLLIIYKLYNRKRYLFLATLLSLFIVFDGAISTSKTPIFMLVILYVVYTNLFDIRINKKFLLVAVLIGIINFYYSYSARYYGNVHGKITAEVALDNLNIAKETSGKEGAKIGSAFVNRFELLDNLIITMKRVDMIDKGYFQFGSLVEVINVIPRFIWTDKPNLQLSYFIVDVVQGTQMKGVSAGFGRIGESFFVLGYFGILYAVINVLIMILIYNKTVQSMGKSPYYFIIYIQLYFTYFAQDNYIFQGFIGIMLSLAAIAFLMFISPNVRIKLR